MAIYYQVNVLLRQITVLGIKTDLGEGVAVVPCFTDKKRADELAEKYDATVEIINGVEE